MNLHFEVPMRNAPEIASFSRNLFLFFECNYEIVHSELPGEKHALVVLTFGVYFIFHAVVPAVTMRVLIVQLAEAIGAAESAAHSILSLGR